jgi:hypothetical protein
MHAASADGRHAGFSTAQFLRYSYTIDVSGNDTGLMSNIQPEHYWINITVLNVSGDNVTCQQVFYNDTSVLGSNTFLIDISLGSSLWLDGSGSPLYILFAAAANLNASDLVYLATASQQPTYTINETVVVNYLGRQFTGNHLDISQSQTNVSAFGVSPVNLTALTDYYWDRGTGVLLDQDSKGYFSRSDGAGGILSAFREGRILLTSATPTVQEFPTFLAMSLFMIASLLAVIVQRNTRHVPQRYAVRIRLSTSSR